MALVVESPRCSHRWTLNITKGKKRVTFRCERCKYVVSRGPKFLAPDILRRIQWPM